ncbi:MAG: LysR family transcriptional regulator [Pseudomonadota bacterium]
MSARLDIDSLRALQAVADLGGVTRAADSLGLSQSAVSHKIRRLEESIDGRLLQRRGGAPLLTADGERLLGYARRIIALHEEALSAIGRKAMKGQIRLGVTEDTTSAGLARILARFTRLYPKVAVRTHVAQSLTLAKALEQGEINLAVMQIFQSEIGAQDIVLGVDRLIWVQALDHELMTRTPVPFIAFDQDCFYCRWAMALRKRDLGAVTLETVLDCASIAGVCNAVLAGLGVALINRRYLQSGMREIQSCLPDPPPIAYVTRLASGSRKRAVAALAREIAEEFPQAPAA